MPQPVAQLDRLLRCADVLAMTGLSKSSVYIAMRREQFPRPVAAGARAVRWRQSQVQEWISARPTAVSVQPDALRQSKRGRPRKSPIIGLPKRPRGRPRKHPESVRA